MLKAYTEETMRLARVALVLTTALLAADSQSFLDQPVNGLPIAGETTAVILKLRDTSSTGTVRGLIGFHRLPGTEPPVSLTRSPATLGETLHEIFLQDARYKLVPTMSASLINIVPVDPRAPGHEVLDFLLAQIDIEADKLPANIIADLPGYSPELSRFLHTLYFKMGPTNPNGGVAASILESLTPPPHFSLHLRNVTVIEALNAIAAHSFDQDNPSGWMFEFTAPGDSPFQFWAWSLFKPM